MKMASQKAAFSYRRSAVGRRLLSRATHRETRSQSTAQTRARAHAAVCSAHTRRRHHGLRTRRWPDGPLSCKKMVLFSECFPYVCPEPVLVKRPFENGGQKVPFSDRFAASEMPFCSAESSRTDLLSSCCDDLQKVRCASSSSHSISDGRALAAAPAAPAGAKAWPSPSGW